MNFIVGDRSVSAVLWLFWSACGPWRMLSNSQDVFYEAESVVHRSELGRLEKLNRLWQCQDVVDGVVGVGRHQLDPRQAFAYDIVTRRGLET